MLKPALRLYDKPGSRRLMLELAQRADDAGFSGILTPGRGDSLGLCEAILLGTKRLRVGTNIVNLFARSPIDYARTASLLNELSGERFVLGVGLGAVEPGRYAGTPGHPLADVRAFVEQYKSLAGEEPSLAPLMVATLRERMVRLAGEVADGATWANGSLSHMAHSLSLVPSEKRRSFVVGNVIRTCVDSDRKAAAQVIRTRLRSYFSQPQYPAYWSEAGFEEEMQAATQAVKDGDVEALDAAMTEEWLADVAIYGTPSEVLQRIEAWHAAGVTLLSLDPLSTTGSEVRAFESVFAAVERA